MSENITKTTHARTTFTNDTTFSLSIRNNISFSNRIECDFFFALKDFKAIHSTKMVLGLCWTMSTFQPLSHKTKDTNNIHFKKEIVVCHLRKPWWCWCEVKSNFPVRSLLDYGDDVVAGKPRTPTLSSSLTLCHSVISSVYDLASFSATHTMQVHQVSDLLHYYWIRVTHKSSPKTMRVWGRKREWMMRCAANKSNIREVTTCASILLWAFVIILDQIKSSGSMVFWFLLRR